MATRPLPILLTMAHHVLALAYMAFHAREAFPITDYSSGQLFAFVWVSVALALLFVRPNIGRWMSCGLFAMAGVGGSIILLYFFLQSGQLFLPLVGLDLVFLYLACALAFGKSTKAYIAKLNDLRNQRRVIAHDDL